MKHNVSIPTTSLGFGIMGKPRETLSAREGGEAKRKVKVLVVDNDATLRQSIVKRLPAATYAVESADGAKAALDACVRSRPNLVITDLRLDDMEGLAFLKELKSRWPQLVVIVITAHGSISEAVQATQCGAFSYLVKPIEKDELLGHLERATAVSTFALADDSNWRAHFASRNQLMEERLALANRAAASDEPVLLTGENGTGKELLARAIHAASARREKPFVAVSCRDATEERLRELLFGAAGAVGGAVSVSVSGDVERQGGGRETTAGAFERARGGSLLIEEIGELPMKLQIALAKTLERDPAAPPGEKRAVRLICTTSVNLRSLVVSGAFLGPLFYQINIMPIEIPPLGRRREDIPLMVSHFLEQATEPGGQKKIYSSKAIELLATHDWPGNVRQLFNLVKQSVAMSHGKVMTKEFVQKLLDGEQAKIPTYEEARDNFSREYLVKNMQQTSGNVTQAARLAKRNRTDFYNLLARYRLHPEDFKEKPEEAAGEANDGAAGFDESTPGLSAHGAAAAHDALDDELADREADESMELSDSALADFIDTPDCERVAQAAGAEDAREPERAGRIKTARRPRSRARIQDEPEEN